MKIQTTVPGIATRPEEPTVEDIRPSYTREDIGSAICSLDVEGYSYSSDAVQELLDIATELLARIDRDQNDHTELVTRARRMLL